MKYGHPTTTVQGVTTLKTSKLARVHNSSPLGPILSQTNLVHIVKPYFFNITFTVILPE
jgi:hypothetical protein